MGKEESEDASAPPLDQLEMVLGYKDVTYTSTQQPPPTYETTEQQQPLQRQALTLVTITDEEVKSALNQFVRDNCCYGSKPVQEMQLNGSVMNSAFHYKIETFTEKRETKWNYEPYNTGKGKPIDGPNCGPAPGPWEVPVSPPVSFENSKLKIAIPHTEQIRPCDKCLGIGRVHCTWCRGAGYKACCSRTDCSSCHGTNRQKCTSCSATGQVNCTPCHSHGYFKFWVQLKVTWTNHVDDFVSDQTELPNKLVKRVSGHVAFDERFPRVFPITNFPDAAINDASLQLIQKHENELEMEKILEQRHNVRMVPVATVNYQWKNEHGIFHVYGLEHKVYFPNYPQNCCCCCKCTIL